MNPRQMALQIRKEIRAVTWPSSGSKVFNDRACFVYEGIPDEEQFPIAKHFCLIGLDGGPNDEDDPGLLDYNFSVLSIADVSGDALGEFAIVGGARADMTKTAGAGVLEIDERVRSAVENLLGVDGAKIMLSATTIGGVSKLGNLRNIAIAEMTLTALCTSAIHYAAPQQLARSGTIWTWEGDHVGDRFDFFQYRLGYKAGSTPPETPADADVLLTAVTSPTLEHTVISSKAYSIFADYNSRGQSSVEGSSSGSEVGAFLTT